MLLFSLSCFHLKLAMEKENGKTSDAKSCATNGIVKSIKLDWSESLTVIDLSSKNIRILDETIVFPPGLTKMSLSHNNLHKIPNAVLKLENLNTLDLSYNSLQYFDETPNFCHSIEELDLSNNRLSGPPYWVWAESPTKLTKINLSCNYNITNALEDKYFEELLQYKTLVTDVILFNCTIRRHLELLSTFPKVKTFVLGTPDLTTFASNHFSQIPCKGLQECCDIQRLNLSNTQVFSIEPNIDIYKNLVEINLSHNKLSGIPNKFCNLENLEICVLSSNSIMYLPDDLVKLKKLVCLRLDSNELCMLPENISSLKNLKILDLYDNSLYETANEIKEIEEIDLAQNYLEEPDDEEYAERKERLRLNILHRHDGRKVELNQPESVYSPDTTDDEELMEYMKNCTNIETSDNNDRPFSSPEDWDSDSYWVPGYYSGTAPPPGSTWVHFVKQKMQEGSFCPMDAHPVSVADTVRYEKQCNPKNWTVVDGQFDDSSDSEH